VLIDIKWIYWKISNLELLKILQYGNFPDLINFNLLKKPTNLHNISPIPGKRIQILLKGTQHLNRNFYNDPVLKPSHKHNIPDPAYGVKQKGLSVHTKDPLNNKHLIIDLPIIKKLIQPFVPLPEPVRQFPAERGNVLQVDAEELVQGVGGDQGTEQLEGGQLAG